MHDLHTSVSTSAHIAFIGTGIMGAPIARHIMDAGYGLTVFNRSKEKLQSLVDAGAHEAATVAEAVADADVVFTMVGYPQDVEEIYLTTDGILAHAKKGAYLIDLTTSSPELARDIHDAAAVSDLHAFDCPVTGGQEGAEAGTLTLIIGADEQTVAPVLPVLQTFSAKQYYFGGAGKGQMAKLTNQVSLASCMLGYADAMALAEQAGLDVEQTLKMIGDGMGGSVALSRLAPKSLAGDFKPGFLVEHLHKDLGLALGSAQDLEITLPGAETAYTLYDLLRQVGGARMGTQAITLLYADQATGEQAGLDWSILDEMEDEADECGGACDHHHHHDHDHHDHDHEHHHHHHNHEHDHHDHDHHEHHHGHHHHHEEGHCCGHHHHEDGHCCGHHHHDHEDHHECGCGHHHEHDHDHHHHHDHDHHEHDHDHHHGHKHDHDHEHGKHHGHHHHKD